LFGEEGIPITRNIFWIVNRTILGHYEQLSQLNSVVYALRSFPQKYLLTSFLVNEEEKIAFFSLEKVFEAE
jgi:hypothetical protein